MPKPDLEKAVVLCCFISFLQELLEPNSDLDSPQSPESPDPDTPGRPSAASAVSATVACPVCNLDFPSSAIEEHVDRCLRAAPAVAAPCRGHESQPEARRGRWARRTQDEVTEVAEAAEAAKTAKAAKAAAKGLEKDVERGPVQKAQQRRVQPVPSREHLGSCESNVSDLQESAQDSCSCDDKQVESTSMLKSCFKLFQVVSSCFFFSDNPSEIITGQNQPPEARSQGPA